MNSLHLAGGGLSGQAVLGVPGGLRWGAQDLGAQALHGVHLLTRHLLGQADDLLVASRVVDPNMAWVHSLPVGSW